MNKFNTFFKYFLKIFYYLVNYIFNHFKNNYIIYCYYSCKYIVINYDIHYIDIERNALLNIKCIGIIHRAGCI